MSILYRFLVIARFSSKVTNFNPPHLHLSPPSRVIPFEFSHDLWHQKTSHGAIMRRWSRDRTSSRFDTILECDRHTDNDDGISALRIASRGKKATNNAKSWVVWGVMGHPKVIGNIALWEIWYDFLLDFNRNYASILYRFRVITRFSWNVANFNQPHLHLSLR